MCVISTRSDYTRVRVHESGLNCYYCVFVLRRRLCEKGSIMYNVQVKHVNMLLWDGVWVAYGKRDGWSEAHTLSCTYNVLYTLFSLRNCVDVIVITITYGIFGTEKK